MFRSYAILFFGLFFRLCSAIHADEAGSIDYALNLLGAPLHRNTLFAKPFPQSKASLLYTLSDKSVVGAINPRDGSVVWRHILNTTAVTSYSGYLSIGQDQEVVYTGVGDTVSAWSAPDGRLIWERSFSGSQIRDVKALELSDETDPVEKDVIVVLEGEQNGVYRLSSRSGSNVWKYHDASSDSLFAVSGAGPKVQVVSLRSAMLKGQKIRVASLDAASGKLIDNTSPSSEDVSSASDVLGVGVTAKAPLLVWTDSAKQTLKVHVLSAKTVASFEIKSKDSVEQVNVHGSSSLSASSHFLVHVQTKRTHWAQVYEVDSKSSKVSKVYDIPEAAGPGSFAASEVGSEVYFTHTTLTESTLYSSRSDKYLTRSISKKSLTPPSLDPDSTVQIEHSAANVVRKTDGSFAIRSAVYLESGHWSLVQNGQRTWTRPEMLAGLVHAEWADTQQSDQLVEELEAETNEDTLTALIHRFVRHAGHLRATINEASSLPALIQSWAASFVGMDGTASSKDKVFGFDKQIIGATRDGDIVVIDPTDPEKVVRQWRDPDFEKIGRTNWNQTTVGSLNGKFAQRLRLPPSSGETENDPRLKAASVSYIVTDSGLEGRLQNKAIWHYIAGPGHQVIRVTSALQDEPVASIGRVLGDRRVLYKYLNPNIILVSSVAKETSDLTVSVLDAVSGSVLYSATHAAVDLGRSFSSVVSENWFSYSFTVDADDESKSRGNQLIMGELFESDIPDYRGPLGGSGNYSSLAPALGSQASVKPHVYAHSFVISEEVSLMTVTQTTQGITSRQLLVYLAGSGSIVGIPPGVLDPRRPVDKEPTRQEQEEGLVRYYPVVDFDPRWHLTHSNVVKGIEHILATPSIMESTSLVFAYGSLDVFGTRVTPSYSFDILGNSFNKAQLLLTVIGLLAGTFAVVPFVQRKQTNALWQA